MNEQQLIELVNDPERNPIYQGTYSEASSYSRDDVVSFLGYYYIAERDVPKYCTTGVLHFWYWKLLPPKVESDMKSVVTQIGQNLVKGICILNELHDPNTAYQQYDVVDLGDARASHYIAMQDVPIGVPLTDENYWRLFSANFSAADTTLSNSVAVSNLAAEVHSLSIPEGSNGIFKGDVHIEGVKVDMEKIKTQNYMVGAGGVIFNHSTEVLLGRRLDYDGNEVWALFGGKPNADESMAEGLAREIAEEVNAKLDAIRYHLLDICEAHAGSNQRCLTAYLWAQLTKEETALVRNLEPHKCFELRWFPYFEAIQMKLWQDSAKYIMQAFGQLAIKDHAVDTVRG